MCGSTRRSRWCSRTRRKRLACRSFGGPGNRGVGATRGPPAARVARELRLLPYFPDDAGGVAGDDDVGGHIVEDDGAEGDDGVLADVDAFEDGGLAADPDVVGEAGRAGAGGGGR